MPRDAFVELKLTPKDTDTEPKTYLIEVIVKNAETGDKITTATVYAENFEQGDDVPTFDKQQTVDNVGRAEIEVPLADTQISASADGYESASTVVTTDELQ